MKAPLRVLPQTLTLLPTYRCTAACKDCCFESNPGISHRVPQERLLKYIDDAARLGSVKQVCISGGEAFVIGDDLVELIAAASKRGMLTRVVTNGYWATSERAARLRLAPLIEAGLTELNFSTGDDHVAWVPLRYVVDGLAVAFSYGLGLALMIEARADRVIGLEDVRREAERHPQLRAAIDAGAIHVVESPWMPFRSTAVPQANGAYINAANVHLRAPCRSVLTTLVVSPGESLGLCCGLTREGIPDLHAGDLRQAEMANLIDQSAYDFLKIWLFVEGPERILAWAASKNEQIDWENRYAHNCDACRRIYRDPVVAQTIAEHFEERYDDVLAKFRLYLSELRSE